MMVNRKDKNKTSITGQVFLVMTGFACNNDCIMCSVKPKGLHYKPRNTEEIITDMKRGKQLQYNRVEFTGGEPTIRNDILLLVEKAKQFGYREIALGTNARTLSSLKFVKSLHKGGLNRVTTTLYGYDSKSHEAVTRVPGSFRQTIQGIKNTLRLGIVTTVNTVVFSLTAQDLQKTGQFLASLGIQYWTLLDLIPDGYALKNYKNLVLNPKELRIAFNSIESTVDDFQAVNIFDFPFCLIPSAILEKKNCSILAAKGRTEIINQVGYKPKRFEEKNDIYFDIHKVRNQKCKECAYNKECGGIWMPYIDLYGTSFIKPIYKRI